MSRIGRVRDAIRAKDLDALIVTCRPNIRYLSGFSGSAGTLVVSLDGCVLLTDARYALQGPAELAAAGVDGDVRLGKGDGFNELQAIVNEFPSLGVEGAHVTWNYAERLRAGIPGEITATTGVVEALRECKDALEVEAMKHSARVADVALGECITHIAEGTTERHLAAVLDAAARTQGADGSAFETIVASGPNAARPHHRPTDRAIENGDLVIIDFGALVNGYRSDMTRSFIVGKGSEQQHAMLDAVLAAQQAGVDRAGPGISVKEVDAACREYLADAGMSEWFTHGTGHGVGLDIHEAPWVNATGTATLAAGHVITVEPGVYIPDVGGVRWEDTIVITNDGSEALTTSPKSPQR
jgi:Xaa-Pro aminopeptidase